MGSHGGANARDRLISSPRGHHRGVGEPLSGHHGTVQLGTSDTDAVYLDKYADEADAIVIVHSVKPHPAFRGSYESGLMKMVTIGMGKQRGADHAHRLGFGEMAANIPSVARVTLAKKNVLCAVCVVENAFHETALLEVLPKDRIELREPELLQEAWKLYPRIFFDELDVLVIDEIGKDICGTGFDTNSSGLPPPPTHRGTQIIVWRCGYHDKSVATEMV
jgi:hypothetical protein